MLQALLDRAEVDAAVRALRPDYRALLLAVDGIEPGASDAESEQLLQQAEAGARQALAGRPVEELPHVAAWREAYRAFGAKLPELEDLPLTHALGACRSCSPATVPDSSRSTTPGRTPGRGARAAGRAGPSTPGSWSGGRPIRRRRRHVQLARRAPARVRADPQRRRGGRGAHHAGRRAGLRQHAAQRPDPRIDVNALVGREFRIGDVRCRGLRLAEPCAHLERLSGPGLLRPLIHRGGLRADILSEGTIDVGSSIST